MLPRIGLLSALTALVLFPALLSSQTITTQPLAKSVYCAGEPVSVSYTVSGGAFNAGNAMILQVSDPEGSFTSGFRNLGSITETGSGVIETTMNFGTGTKYRFRVIASNPRVNGADNGTDITVEAQPSINIGFGPEAVRIRDSSFILQGQAVTLTNFTGGASSYWWNLGIGVGASIEQTDEAKPTVTYSTPGIKEIKFWATSPNGCIMQTRSIRLNVLATSPVIPADVIIVRGDTTIDPDAYDPRSPFVSIWICPGGICRLYSPERCFVYVEGGGTLITPEFNSTIIYAKEGAACIGKDGGQSWFFYENGASIPTPHPERYTRWTQVPSLTFDYSNVPPGGCPSLAPYTVQIKQSANNIHAAQNDDRSNVEYWVQSGGALSSSGSGNTYYVENGGHAVIDGSENRVYVKNGGTVDVQGGSGNRIFYELDGRIVNGGSEPILLPSSGITFDVEVSSVWEESVTSGGTLVQISPNPVLDQAEIRVEPILGPIRHVTVLNVLGEVVLEMNDVDAGMARISTDELAGGVYHLRIQTDRTEVVRMMIVQ